MEKQFAQELLEFINIGCSTFHVVEGVKEKLNNAGFVHLDPNDSWELEAGMKYYVIKNNSALFAWIQGLERVRRKGFNIIASHTDSPTFKIKPNPEIQSAGCIKLNIEAYGGSIIYSWFDRPLSVAGRVMLKGEKSLSPKEVLINIKRPILVIPSLAIHLNRSVNDGVAFSKQKDILPILSRVGEELESGNSLVKLIAKELHVKENQILDFDLTLYEVTKGAICGSNNEFVSSGRLDDLAMVHASLSALLSAKPTDSTLMIALFDNEEVGSSSKQGAGSPFLSSILKRICLNNEGSSEEDYFRAIAHSFLISADMAHALHPNYVEKYDITNHPIINGGPVVKSSANQKYITDAYSSAVFKSLCQEAGVDLQYFVNHSDSLGGSTLGNILLSQIDINGVDVGNPMWGMHSVRETAGVKDHLSMFKVFQCFFR